MTLRVTQQVVEALVVNPTGGSTVDEAITTSIDMAVPLEIFSPVDESITTSIGVDDELVDSGNVDISLSTLVSIDSTVEAPGEADIKTSIGISHKVHDTEDANITSSIAINQTSADNFETEDITTTVNIDLETIDDTGDDLSAFLQTDVGINQELIGSLTESLTTSVGINSEVKEILFPKTSVGINDTLVVEEVQPPISSTAAINDTLTVQTVENIDLSTSINVQDPLGAVTNVDTCKYDPQVGSSAGPFTPPSLTPPSIVKGTLTLSQGAMTVELRNPQFGNLDTLSFTRINRDSRGGTLLVFADPSWPKSRRFEFTVPNLKNKDELDTFLAATLGEEITLTDWQGRVWTGVITNAPEFTQIGRSVYSVDFIFEVTP